MGNEEMDQVPITAPNLFSVSGHQVAGYELIARKVSRVNRFSGRITLPLDWAGKRVKIIIGDEVYDDVPRAVVKQARVNVHHKYVGETAHVVRLEPLDQDKDEEVAFL